MKCKVWFITLVLVILTICCFGSAVAAPGDTVLFPDTEDTSISIKSFAADKDTLYTLMYDGILYHYQLGMAQPTVIAEGIDSPGNYATVEEFEQYSGQIAADGIDTIYVKDGQLYALNLLTGQFSTVACTDGIAALTPIITLDLAPITVQEDDYRYIGQLVDTVFTGDTLYLLITDYVSSDWGKQILAVYSLTDSQAKIYDTQHIMAVTPYKEGKMLAQVFDRETAYSDLSGEEHFPELHILDLATGTTEKIMEFDNNSIAGLRYQAENDTLYYFSGGSIMMMPALSAPQLAAYLPINWLDSNANVALMNDNLYAAATYRGIFLKNTDPSYLPTTTLNVYGGYANGASLAFSLSNPDVAVKYADEYYDNSQALGQAMVSGENALDVLMVDTTYGGFASMMKKGYCLDLSTNEKISQAVSNMYPFIQDAVSADGKIYAVPVSIYRSTNSFTYATNELSEMNLTLEDLPTTYLELCEFITRWNDEWMDTYDNMRPIYWEDMGLALYHTIIQDYISYYEYLGEDVKFDTPLFRNLMTALENMDSSNLDLPEDASEDMRDALWNQMSLLNTGIGGDLYSDTYYLPLPMTLSADTGSFAGYTIQVAFINPRSQNIDAALDYLTAYMDGLDDHTKTMLRSDMTEPVLNPYFDQYITSWTEEITRLEKLLTTCPPEEKKGVETNLAYMQELLVNQEQYRYNITAEAIANYIENVVPIAYVSHENLLYTNDQGSVELQNLQDRYLSKQITLDQFIKEADNKLRMILLERR